MTTSLQKLFDEPGAPRDVKHIDRIMVERFWRGETVVAEGRREPAVVRSIR